MNAAQTTAPAAGMTMPGYIQNAWTELSDACTRCGKCVEACPVTPTLAEVAAAPPGEVIGGLFDFMNGAPLPSASRQFTASCNGCGVCIEACPEKINPRRMLMMAWGKVSATDKPTPHTFQKMAKATRLFVAMQLLPPEAAKMLRTPRPRDVDVVFHGGCNPIRTPNLLFNAMTLMDILGINYEFMGGPSTCCGVVHSKWEGDLQRGGKVSELTLHKFGEFKPSRVVEWCPTCQIHMNESIKGYRDVQFSVDHITTLLTDHLEQLKAACTTPIEQRVIVHSHQGPGDAGDKVRQLLEIIPGVTIVEVIEEPGYMCGVSGSDRSPALRAEGRARTIDRMKETGADCLVSLYHSCHRQLLAEARRHGFKTLNYTELLVRACGAEPWRDTMEPLLGRTDWANLVREVMPNLQENGIEIDPDELLAVIPELFAGAEWKGGLCSFAPGA